MTTDSLNQLIAELRIRPELFDDSAHKTDDMIDRLEEAQHRGYLNRAELIAVCKEKSSRRANEAKRNSEQDVSLVTETAFKIKSERIRISLLTSLHGVGVPTASAILAWTYPDRWGVIDRRAWSTLINFGVVKKCRNGVGLRAEEWEQYCVVLATIAAAFGIRPQHADKLLYGYDKARKQGSE